MLLDCGYEQEQAFYDRLKHIAYKARSNAIELARRTYHHRMQVSLDLTEYLVLTESAAFLAFVQLGGNVDKPLEFDWTGREDELVTAATALVRRDLQEKGSESHDVDRRNRFRQDGALNEASRWDAWNDRGGEERHEREHVAEALEGLLPELRREMRESDVRLLVWHYVDGLTWRDIAKKLGGGNMGTICMSIMRAKRRAAKVLGPKWHNRIRDALLAAS